MTRITKTTLLMCATVLAAAGTARAETTYIVDKVTITGSKTVPTSKLLAAIQEHKGSRVTQADIVADQDTITKILGQANVVGGIKTSMAARGNHVEVTFILDDQGAQAPVVHKVAPKLHAERFTGNTAVSSDKLAAAAGLNPGDDLSNAKIQAAQKAIVEAYKANTKRLNVSVSGGITPAGDDKVDVLWTVVETKQKAVNKDNRSPEAQDQIQ